MTDLPAVADLNDPATTEGDFQAAIGAMYAYLAELIAGFAAFEANTISTGAITPTKTAIIVDTESAAAADNLDNIIPTNIGGKLIFIKATSAARVVTLRHLQGGSGQIYTLTGSSIVLDSVNKVIALWYNTSADRYEEVFRNFGVYLPGSGDIAALIAQIGAAKTAGGNTFSGAQVGHVTALTSTAGSVAVDLSVDCNFSLPLTEDTEIANPTNVTSGQGGQIGIIQHASSAKTLTLASNWKEINGTTPAVSTTLGAKNIISFYAQDSSTIWYSLSKGGVT